MEDERKNILIKIGLCDDAIKNIFDYCYVKYNFIGLDNKLMINQKVIFSHTYGIFYDFCDINGNIFVPDYINIERLYIRPPIWNGCDY
jgi:hypothetical protein